MTVCHVTHTHTHTHTHTYTHTHTHHKIHYIQMTVCHVTHTHTHTHIHTHTHTHTSQNTYIHTYKTHTYIHSQINLHSSQIAFKLLLEQNHIQHKPHTNCSWYYKQNYLHPKPYANDCWTNPIQTKLHTNDYWKTNPIVCLLMVSFRSNCMPA